MSRLDYAGLAKQTGAGAGGLGTEQTVMEYFVPVESAERGPNLEDMTAEETLGHPFPTDLERGVRFFTPSMIGKARAASLPRILSGYFGDPLTTTPDAVNAPTARNHNFEVVARPTPRAHSILLGTDGADGATTDLVDVFWDALGQEIALDVEMNDWISFEASYVAREIDEAQPAPAVTADLTRRFPFYEAKAYVDVNGAGEAEIPVATFGLTYGLNVPTDVGVLGSQTLYRIRPGNRDASVRFTPRVDMDDWYRRAIADGDLDDVKIRLEALGSVIGGAIRFKVEIIAHRCQVQEAPIDIDAGETLEGVEVVARCAYDAANSKFAELNVVNVVNAY